MARTQKNKATEYHLGLLKAKLARYRAQLLEPASKSGPAGVGFDVQKSGDARVALIGFPSVGKVRVGTRSRIALCIQLHYIVYPAEQDNAYHVRIGCVRIHNSYRESSAVRVPECATLQSRQFPESSTIKALEFNFSICQESSKARVKAAAAAVKSSPQPKRQISSLSC